MSTPVNIKIFRDIVQYTTPLDFQGARVTGTSTSTVLEALRRDGEAPAAVLRAQFLAPVPEFQGEFGIQNLGRLAVILNLPVYRDDAQAAVAHKADGTTFLEIQLASAQGNFRNSFRLANTQLIPAVDLTSEPDWIYCFEPTEQAVQHLRYLAQSVSDDPAVEIFSQGTDLIMRLGDVNNSQGQMVFHDYAGTEPLQQHQFWTMRDLLQALSLPAAGKVLSLSNQGMLKLDVQSDIAQYTYYFPGLSK